MLSALQVSGGWSTDGITVEDSDIGHRRSLGRRGRIIQYYFLKRGVRREQCVYQTV